MKTKCLNLHLIFCSMLGIIPAAFAADPMLRVCTAEIKKFGCDAKSETYAYECLSKHKEQRTKHKGFGAKCFKAYASYEKATGKGEPIESHQVEHREHTN